MATLLNTRIIQNHVSAPEEKRAAKNKHELSLWSISVGNYGSNQPSSQPTSIGGKQAATGWLLQKLRLSRKVSKALHLANHKLCTFLLGMLSRMEPEGVCACGEQSLAIISCSWMWFSRLRLFQSSCSVNCREACEDKFGIRSIQCNT